VQRLIGKNALHGAIVGVGAAGRSESVETDDTFVTFEEDAAINAFADGPHPIPNGFVGDVPPGILNGQGTGNGENAPMTFGFVI